MTESAEQFWARMGRCIQAGEVRASSHGYEELAHDGLFYEEVLAGFPDGRVVEFYPEYPKGPCLLLRQSNRDGTPVHVLWGIPKGRQCPVVLITAYRPDPARWNETFTRRK